MLEDFKDGRKVGERFLSYESVNFCLKNLLSYSSFHFYQLLAFADAEPRVGGGYRKRKVDHKRFEL